MPTTRMTLKEAQVFFSSGGPLGQTLKGAMLKGLLSAALRAKRDIVSREIPNFGGRKPIDRGIYRAGWQVEKLPNGAAIYNALPTAAIVEYGVPAGNVVLGNKAQIAIAEWVQRKLGGRRRVTVAAQRKSTAAINAAKLKFDKSKASWTIRSKKAIANGKPAPPRPKAPAILTSKGRQKHDFGFAWGVAGAILHSMKKKGIFGGGKGLRILETYTRTSLKSVIEQECEREIARAVG